MTGPISATLNPSLRKATKKHPGKRTTTLKKLLFISLAVGFVISTSLLILERLTDYSGVMSWEMPGLTAAVIFWGSVSDSVILGVAIAWTVNAIVYSLPAFVVFGLFKVLKTPTPR